MTALTQTPLSLMHKSETQRKTSTRFYTCPRPHERTIVKEKCELEECKGFSVKSYSNRQQRVCHLVTAGLQDGRLDSFKGWDVMHWDSFLTGFNGVLSMISWKRIEI